MIIKSITLEKFRQYKEKCIFNFSLDNEKNVTVITGDNTCGKTTLVQSFIWCLYGKDEFKDKIKLNADEYESLKNGTMNGLKECSVTIDLFHDDEEYIVKRIEKYVLQRNGAITTSQSFKIYENENGNYVPLDEEKVDNLIQEILPENLSSYFFFWGEKIEKLTEKKELSESVKQFLGLDTLDSAIKHLEQARKKVSSSLVGESANSEMESYQKRINKYEAANKTLSIKVESLKSNIAYYQEKANKLFNDLTTSENKELNSRQEDYRQKKNQLASLQKDLDKYRNRFKEFFNDSKNYVYCFANEQESIAVELLEKNKDGYSDRGWAAIDLNAINEIIKRGKCICGNEVCEGNAAFKYLIHQKELVAPNVIGGAVNSFIESSERRTKHNNQYVEDIHETYKKINNIQDDIADLEYDVSQLEKRLRNTTNIKDKQEEYNEIKRDLDSKQNELGGYQNEIERNKNQIDLCERKISDLATKDRKYRRLSRQLGYIESLLNMFKGDYQNNEKALKEQLEKNVSENFNEVYSGNRKIEINERYNAIAKNKVGDKWIESETSPGLETVKNFAFIVGLLQCAKEKIILDSEEGDLANSNDYPLVLDAPFSQADEKHIPKICDLISNNAEQIILVVMNKDWNYAKDVLASKVGQFYELKKKSETNTTVEEVTYHD